MSKRVWVIGPVAWDIALYLEEFPTPGSFSRAKSRSERIGGSAFNIAHGLATAGIEVGFIGYVGNDAVGKQVLAEVAKSEIKFPLITTIDGETNSPLLLISPHGERTVIAQNKSHLPELSLDGADIAPGDIVGFALWRDFFLPELKRAQAKGCMTVVGLQACADEAVHGADLAIGSSNDCSGPFDTSRFSEIVVTDGERGADYFSKDLTLHHDIFPASVLDATGAGDSFIAGFLAAVAKEMSPEAALRVGSAWASLAVEQYDSLPPHWTKVVERYPDVRL